MNKAIKHGLLTAAWLSLVSINAHRVLHGDTNGWWLGYWAAFAAGVNFTRWTHNE